MKRDDDDNDKSFFSLVYIGLYVTSEVWIFEALYISFKGCVSSH